MESVYYSFGSTTGVEGTDGGKWNNLYEVGTDLQIGTTSATCYNSVN